MKKTKPALSRYEQYLADQERRGKRQREWELQPKLIGNAFNEGNGPGLIFDWHLDAFGRHAATPYRGALLVYVHWPANPTIIYLVYRYSPDIVGQQGGLIRICNIMLGRSIPKLTPG